MNDYGIQNDKSDYHLHVGFGTRTAYFFPTQNAIEAIQSHRYNKFEASQPGVDFVTGSGLKVPWREIQGCVELRIPDDLIPEISRDDQPDDKGSAAQTVAKSIFLLGFIDGVPRLPQEVTDIQQQRNGIDLAVPGIGTIQVKCDWWGGRTGLRIQTAEANPLKLH